MLFDEVEGIAGEGSDVATITIEGLVDILKKNKNFLLSQDVERFVRFVGFADGVLSVNLEDGHPREIIRNINAFFATHNMEISVKQVDDRGEDTLEQKKKKLFEEQLAEVSKNPILKEILECFTNSKVANIEDL